MPAPRLAVVAAGAMGAAVGARLVRAGCTVLTTLDGRSPATRRRAADAGMRDAPLAALAAGGTVRWVLSILPPREAEAFAAAFARARGAEGEGEGEVTFVDCNAVNPESVRRIAGVLRGVGGVRVLDAGIIGGPPGEGYDPTFYVSGDGEDAGEVRAFEALGEYGLKVKVLSGEGVGVGDASALKMSYAGISKGTTGLLTTMVLAAHASSPTTASALLAELGLSQRALLARLTHTVPPMLPKAHRWVGEMEEIAGFVGGAEGGAYRGLARVYERVARSVEGRGGGERAVLERFVEEARRELEGGSG